MAATVRVDFTDLAGGDCSVHSKLRRTSVIHFFEKMATERDNEIADLALILHVDGADVAVVCAHHAARHAASSVELF